MLPGIIELDLHNLNCGQAKIKIDSLLRRAGGSIYTIRLIHGYRGGTRIKEMIGEEYGCGRHEKYSGSAPAPTRGSRN